MLLSEARFGELDAYLFGQGNHNEIYKKLGAHPAEDEKGNKGFYFAVWAPNALRVSVVGEFNEWGEKDGGCFMEKVGDIGVWDVFIPGIKVGDMYKFRIFAANGRILDKADPYGNWAELRPGTASRAADISDFKWTDSAWLKKRAKTDVHTNPMAVYEVHPGSWRKHEATDENPAGYYNYREFAEELADYVKSMGYTHVELMGIATMRLPPVMAHRWISNIWWIICITRASALFLTGFRLISRKMPVVWLSLTAPAAMSIWIPVRVSIPTGAPRSLTMVVRR